MILRGIMARRLLSFTIFTLTGLVIAGIVVSVAFSRLTHVSRGSAGALVLLGMVAIATQSVASVRLRQRELGLAQLRGRRGLRLLGQAVAEPVVVVLAGAATGIFAGWFVTRLIVQAWLPAGSTASIGRDELVGVGLATVAAIVVVVACTWRIARAPLMAQLSGVGRSRETTTTGLFLQLLLVIGALVAVYQASQATQDRLDWLSLLSPALVGLAAGQVVVWLVVAVLAFVVPRSVDGPLGWFITLRRLLRRADGLAVVRIVVAAGVLAGVAASASMAAQTWREERARLQVGAPVSYPVPAGALTAYAATRAADPKGQWLVAVASYTTDESPAERRVFVDTARWQRVVGDFYAGTAVAPLTAEVSQLQATSTEHYVHGSSMSVTVTARSLSHSTGVIVSVDYVNDAGILVDRDVPLLAKHEVPAGPGLRRFSVAVEDCRAACSVSEIDITGRTTSPIRLVDVTFAGWPLLEESSGIALVQTIFEITSERVVEGVDVTLRRGYRGALVDGTLATFAQTEVLNAIATHGVAFDRAGGHPTIGGVDGAPRSIRITDTLPVLPFVGTGGILVDLASVLVGSTGSIPATKAVILARSGTPSSVIERLRAAHTVGRPMTYSQALARLDATPRSQGTRLYLLVAAIAALIGLVSVVSSVAQQVSRRRQEAASLRSAGVAAAEIAGAYRREAAALAGVTVIASTVAAWAASRALLPALPLVSGWLFAPPLDAAPRPLVIASSSLGAGAFVGLVSYLTFRSVARSSPPSLLREEEA